jgi:hypothetical protein
VWGSLIPRRSGGGFLLIEAVAGDKIFLIAQDRS